MIHAAVVGVPDPILGEAVRLVVAVAEGSGISERRLRQHCHEHLEDFMQPKFVEIWPELPGENASAGKIDKPRHPRRPAGKHARRAARVRLNSAARSEPCAA